MAKGTREPALLLKMKHLYTSLSKAEKLVIDQIILDPSKVIHLSVAGLAEQCGTSEATVVRACRRLGLEGYQDLKVTLAQDIVSPLESINEEIEPGDDANKIVDIAGRVVATFEKISGWNLTKDNKRGGKKQ